MGSAEVEETATEVAETAEQASAVLRAHRIARIAALLAAAPLRRRTTQVPLDQKQSSP
jgi:hypothetical protein